MSLSRTCHKSRRIRRCRTACLCRRAHSKPSSRTCRRPCMRNRPCRWRKFLGPSDRRCRRRTMPSRCTCRRHKEIPSRSPLRTSRRNRRRRTPCRRSSGRSTLPPGIVPFHTSSRSDTFRTIRRHRIAHCHNKLGPRSDRADIVVPPCSGRSRAWYRTRRVPCRIRCASPCTFDKSVRRRARIRHRPPIRRFPRWSNCPYRSHPSPKNPTRFGRRWSPRQRCSLPPRPSHRR
jgi:hypothetical protein